MIEIRTLQEHFSVTLAKLICYQPFMLSIIMPTLNAAKHLPNSLNALVPGAVGGLVKELIVVDGGSNDQTLAMVDEAGALIIEGEKGRGPQLVAGAAVAKADWLLFLHADTVLDEGWIGEVREFISNSDGQKAGVFRFALDDRRRRAQVLEMIVLARCGLFALPYGDQGLLISRQMYDGIGGFKPLVLMEDVDMIQRIGRGRLHYFQSRAVTSAERYKREGYVKRMARNAKCLALWFAGVAPEKILERYQ